MSVRTFWSRWLSQFCKEYHDVANYAFSFKTHDIKLTIGYDVILFYLFISLGKNDHGLCAHVGCCHYEYSEDVVFSLSSSFLHLVILSRCYHPLFEILKSKIQALPSQAILSWRIEITITCD
jgi:hypothetical protein